MGVTDDERRRAAAALRAHAEAPAPWHLSDALDDALGETGDHDKIARLADLIDPDREDGRYEGVRTARPVDRDALLEMAEALEDGFRLEGSSIAAHQVLDAVNVELGRFARRIREACGEVVA